ERSERRGRHGRAAGIFHLIGLHLDRVCAIVGRVECAARRRNLVSDDDRSGVAGCGDLGNELGQLLEAVRAGDLDVLAADGGGVNGSGAATGVGDLEGIAGSSFGDFLGDDGGGGSGGNDVGGRVGGERRALDVADVVVGDAVEGIVVADQAGE